MATRQAAGSSAFAFLRKRVITRPRFGRGPKMVAIVVLLLAAIFGGLSAWAIQYDDRTINLKPDWKSGLSASLLDQAKKVVAIAPKNARLDTSGGFLKVIPDADGRALDLDRAKTLLSEGVQRGDKQIRLPVIHPKAAVQQDSFATVLLVRTGENKLYLYR